MERGGAALAEMLSNDALAAAGALALLVFVWCWEGAGQRKARKSVEGDDWRRVPKEERKFVEFANVSREFAFVCGVLFSSRWSPQAKDATAVWAQSVAQSLGALRVKIVPETVGHPLKRVFGPAYFVPVVPAN